MIVGAVASAVLVGAYWCWSYAFEPAVVAWVLAGHAIAGVAIGLVGRLLEPRGSAAARGMTGAIASFVSLGVVPSGMFFLVPTTVDSMPALAMSLSARAIGALLVLLAGRVWAFGPVALGVAGIALLGATAREHSQLLPAWRVVPEQRDAQPVMARVAVIGIDGGDWSVIDPMIAAGELPNLAALVARGRTAVLESIEPTYSPVVWSTIFTGKTAEKHGIVGWYSAHAANRQAAMLWEILAGAGMSSVVVNVPGSWPPSSFQGALVSGFPIPSVLRLDANSQAELLGYVVAEIAHDAGVPTIATRREGDTLVATLDLAEPARKVKGFWRNLAIERDRMSKHSTLRSTPRELPVRVHVRAADGRRWVEVGSNRLELGPGEWSPWLTEHSSGIPVRFRVRELDDGIYVTPFFQDPGAPVRDFGSSHEVEAAVARNGMYVVEGIGWKSASDPALRDALFEHQLDVEDQHVGAALSLAAARDWSLFVTVITITDRISHAFWPYRDPTAYGLAPDAVRPADAQRVAEAYRAADARLGRIVNALGDDVTILVLSDHGFRSDPPQIRGNHRLEGIFVAAGPGVAPSAERGKLGILDVTPTLLAALGLPPARDMDGRPALGFGGSARVVDTYEAAYHAAGSRVIDRSTEEQLRSLGYVE